MSGRLSAVLLVVAVQPLYAQVTRTPATACNQLGLDYEFRARKADPNSSKPANRAAIATEGARLIRGCAERLSVTKGSVAELTSLSNLWLRLGEPPRARTILSALLARPRLTRPERADVLMAAIYMATTEASPKLNTAAEDLVRELDSLGDELMGKQIDAHSAMLAHYQRADVVEGVRHHANALIALGRRGLAGRARARSVSTTDLYQAMTTAYSTLARVAADYLHTDSALMFLAQGERELGAGYPASREAFAPAHAAYSQLGRNAPAIDGKWWVNAPDGSVIRFPTGRVTILQFTAHWCVPCKKSYPPTVRLMERYKSAPVQSIMATTLYGYVGAAEKLTADQEVAANRRYYREEHGLDFPIAISPPRPAGRVTDINPQYAVDGLPQIVLIDRKGVIRAVVLGWEVPYEARFAAFIDKLLAEK